MNPRIFYLALNNDGILASKELRQAVAQAMTTDFVAQFGDLAKPWNQLMASTIPQSDPEGTHDLSRTIPTPRQRSSSRPATTARRSRSSTT